MEMFITAVGMFFTTKIGNYGWVKCLIISPIFGVKIQTHSANGPWKKKFELYFPY